MSFEDLARLVALPSVHDGEHAEACSAAADLVVGLFADAGVDDVRRVPTDDGSDAVVGETTVFGPPLPVTGLVVDQQAALLAELAWGRLERG